MNFRTNRRSNSLEVRLVIFMSSGFVTVKCKCENEQTIFTHATQKVECNKCGAVLAEPKGGKAIILGKIVKESN